MSPWWKDPDAPYGSYWLEMTRSTDPVPYCSEWNTRAFFESATLPLAPTRSLNPGLHGHRART